MDGMGQLDHSMKNHRLRIHDHLNTQKFVEVHQCFFWQRLQQQKQQDLID